MARNRIACALFVVALAWMGAARAAPTGPADKDAKTARRVETLHRLAMEDFDLGDHPGAQKQLEEALRLARAAQPPASALVVRTHLALALVLGVGLKADDRAVAELKAALELDPKLELSEESLVPRLTALLEKARTELIRAKAPPKDVGPVSGIAHVPVDSAAEGTAIALTARVGADVKAKSVVLHFRSHGARTFAAIPMKLGQEDTFAAEIPAEATAAEAVEYYIEARNAKNKVAATRGNAGAPLVIGIARTRPAGTEPLDRENPLDKI